MASSRPRMVTLGAISVLKMMRFCRIKISKFFPISFRSSLKSILLPLKGEFKRKIVTCRAACKQEFMINVEKQTDINIATAMIDLAESYDKMLLLTADTDQLPAIRLLKKLYPTKKLAVIIPIGRGAKQLKKVCGGNAYKITEERLRDCQLSNPIPIMRDGRQISLLVKPTIWP